MTQTNGKTSHAHGSEELITLNDHTAQSNLQIQCNPIKIKMSSQNFFFKSEVYMEPKKSPYSQGNPKQKEQSWKHYAT